MPEIQQVLLEQNTQEKCNEFNKDNKEGIDRSEYKFERTIIIFSVFPISKWMAFFSVAAAFGYFSKAISCCHFQCKLSLKIELQPVNMHLG